MGLRKIFIFFSIIFFINSKYIYIFSLYGSKIAWIIINIKYTIHYGNCYTSTSFNDRKIIRFYKSKKNILEII
jgi:uncharacterized membrane protein